MEKCIDRISDLPDYVLYHILSFLKTKQVVQTSLLSTRWRYLWSFITNIDLENNPSDDLMFSCLGFIDNFLSLHDGPDIEKFYLVSYATVDFPRLNSWITTIIKFNVKNLELDLPVEGNAELPLGLFTCHSLVDFKLHVESTLNAPLKTYFPNLRKLHLSKVKFSDNDTARRLLSSCPIIDELVLINCDWKNVYDVSISIPSLRKLTITQKLHYWHKLNCVIKISAPKLKYLNISSSLSVHFYLSDVCSLEEAYLDIHYDEWATHVRDRAFDILKSIYNAKVLRITDATFKCIFRMNDVWEILAGFPKFHNLMHLEVSEFYAIYSGALLIFLRNTPRLEVLDLSQGSEKAILLLLLSLLKEIAPPCFYSSLKRISFRNFTGAMEEKELLEFVLRNAHVLECMYIHQSCVLFENTEALNELHNYLQTLPRVSENCKFEFV